MEKLSGGAGAAGTRARRGLEGKGPAMPDPARGARPAGGGAAAALLPGAPRASQVPPLAGFRLHPTGRHPPNGRPAGARPVTGADRAPADPAISKPCRFTGPGREPPEHAVIGKIKTAGRRLAHSVKCRAWTAGPGPAP